MHQSWCLGTKYVDEASVKVVAFTESFPPQTNITRASQHSTGRTNRKTIEQTEVSISSCCTTAVPSMALPEEEPEPGPTDKVSQWVRAHMPSAATLFPPGSEAVTTPDYGKLHLLPHCKTCSKWKTSDKGGDNETLPPPPAASPAGSC